MKLVGYARNDFTVKETGTKITGYNVYVSTPVATEKGKGQIVERFYLSDSKINKAGIDLEAMLGKSVTVNYNRFGKPETIVVDG